MVYFTELIMTMTWVNSDNPDKKIECPWYAQGVDTAGEKGVGKALTYGEKYFLLKFFNIATDDMDPDSFQKNVESKKQPDPISSEQSETLTALFKAMATATGKPETVVKSAYLSKAHVAHINDLNYETANQMIVTKHRRGTMNENYELGYENGQIAMLDALNQKLTNISEPLYRKLLKDGKLDSAGNAQLDVLNSIRDWQIERIEELHD